MTGTTQTTLEPPPKPPGLINSAIAGSPAAATAVAPAPKAAPAPAFSSGAQAKFGQWGLTEDDISTEKQAAKVLDPNSAMMQQVQGQSDMSAAKRGLINSSMAVEAGQQAMISKALDIVNPTIDRVTGMATTDRNNAAAMEREQASIAGQMSLASMNNAAAMDRTKLQLSAEEANQLRDLKARADLQKESLSAADKQQLRDLESRSQQADKALQGQKDIAQLQIEAAKGQSAQNFAQQLQLSDKQTEAAIAMADKQAAAALQAQYRSASQATYDSYLRDVQAIETSDMTGEAKTQHVANLNALYSQRQTYTNSIYTATPGWSKDWQQIGIEFGKGA